MVFKIMTSRELKPLDNPALVTSKEETETGYFSMSLRLMPKAARAKFKRLKTEGKVTGSMNDYMRTAFLEKLNRDDI